MHLHCLSTQGLIPDEHFIYERRGSIKEELQETGFIVKVFWL